MNPKKLLYLVIMVLTLLSCSKDDSPSKPTPTPTPTPENTAPVITNTTKTFTVAENINDTFVIGTMTATDADDDTLTFSITTNSDNLFEISATGALSLAAGKTLNATTKSSHALSIGVNDGTVTTKANFTVNVTQVVATNEPPVIQAQSFEVAENIADTEIFATVVATDADNDQADLTFTMVEDASGHFDITPNGGLKLGDGESLDFATPEHTFTVSVSDGNTAAQATITITVTEVVVVVINEAPSIEAQLFEVPEDISDSDIIGTVLAADPDEGDTLSFSIAANDNGLFEITEEGELSLAGGQSLDFETTDEHTITIEVTDDNNDPVSTEITITVTNVIENLFEDPESFITIWQTSSQSESISIGVNAGLNLPFNYTVDWGDGTVENIAHSNTISHVYAGPGAHQVAIKGSSFPALRMYNVTQANRNKLTRIAQWGNNLWKSMFEAFYYCQNLTSIATDTPNLSAVNSTKSMFEGAVFFNSDINDWNVSNVTNMSLMFYRAVRFNQDLNDWNVSNVTNMSYMFASDVNSPTAFNGDISSWIVDNVTDMQYMFAYNTSFNRNLSQWNVSNVDTMNAMFNSASAFNNASIGTWEFNSMGVTTANMLNLSGLSPAIYSSILIGWASNTQPSGLAIGALGLNYCDNQQTVAARMHLTTTKSWSITDYGAVPCGL
ncbi:BspA family leucine-rich repeat surface protein [Flagellimonas iocasae]|uniref:BspA family leucine-rich repeat surface protein n=1 Tax=Flagellimonas iocasae TaxID=2055905 RepID=A0ABW4XTB5_9FLAO